MARDEAYAAHCFSDRAETRLVAVRAALTVAGQAHHHQAGVVSRKPLVAEVPFLQRARAEILHHDVAIARYGAHDRLSFRQLEVDGDRLLVPRLCEPPQGGALVQLAPGAQRVTTVRRFDLDHLGTEFRQQPRAERPGDQRAELEDAQPLQWTHATASRLAHRAPDVT